MIYLRRMDFVKDDLELPIRADIHTIHGFDLTVTSPPYNLCKEYGSGSDDAMSYEDYLSWSSSWLRRLHSLSNLGGRLCLNIPLDKNLNGSRPMYRDLLDCAIRAGWKYHTTIVWNEQNISRRTAWGSWMSASAPYVISPVEMIVVMYNGEFWKRDSLRRKSTISRDDFMAWTNGVWTFSGEKKSRIGHPAPFPLELPRRCVELFSFEGDVVFDPFSGSGTTAIAAASLGRIALGCDVEQAYVDLAKSRISSHFENKIECFQF